MSNVRQVKRKLCHVIQTYQRLPFGGNVFYIVPLCQATTLPRFSNVPCNLQSGFEAGQRLSSLSSFSNRS